MHKDILAVYDNPRYSDRYTVVLNKSWEANDGRFQCLGFNAIPTSPNAGISQFGECVNGSHLGIEIAFSSLPEDLQAHVIGRLEQ